MTIPTKKRIFLLAALLATSLTAIAGASETTLKQSITSTDGWVGYSVPMIASAGTPCCYSIRDDEVTRRGCSLDGNDWAIGASDDESKVPDHDEIMKVFLRVKAGKIEQTRAFGASCPVKDQDKVRWLDNVAAADSVAMLSRSAGEESREHADEALAALAMHAEASATAALAELAAQKQPTKLREQSLFWLGQMRGVDGAEIVERAAISDNDPKVRAHAVFVLSESKAVDGYAMIHRIAQRDPSDHVREQALFWMAQMGDPRAQADITAAIRNDTVPHVREQGVFALSQLKGEQADQGLIELVRGDYPRPVKKQALFWLGESSSVAALAFLDSMLLEGRIN